MENIFILLQELDRLYYADTKALYECKWQMVARRIQQAFPGFTLAYAELSTEGVDRQAHSGMRHVLLPKPERINR